MSMSATNGAIPPAVLASVNDPIRFTPMLAGACFMRSVKGRRGLLIVRTAGSDVEISAPMPLLERVFSLCDGTRTQAEVLADETVGEQERGELDEFMAFLMERGALIDANVVCVNAVAYGFQFSPFGLAAPTEITNTIATRFIPTSSDAETFPAEHGARVDAAPLDALFAARQSHYTFDDRGISAEALHALLWSAAGVVSTRHPRNGAAFPQRTLASAGAMHLLQIYVALIRPTAPYMPGVYRVDYPAERTVLLRKLPGSNVDELPLTNSKPWHLTFATGAIFIAADPAIGAMRYRARSLQYLFMEAGAALHNVALSASALGLGQATIGGYYEQAVARLCGLRPGELVLGSAIFGAQATERQQAQLALVPDIDFAWVKSDSTRFSMPFHLARAKIKSGEVEQAHTWGRGTDPLVAMRKAVAEAIERDGYRHPPQLIQARLSDLPGALDPCAVIAYAERQYRAAGFPYAPFDAAREHWWAKGVNLATRRPTHLLAQLVYSHAALSAKGWTSGQPVTHATTSGCAAGADFDDAARRAMLELIERDAFSRHWLSQAAGSVIPEGCWPAGAKVRLQAIEATGARVLVQRLETPLAHVAQVAVQHHAAHFTTLGLSANSDLEVAIEGALDEVEARVYAWLHGHRPTIKRHEQVRTAEHHFELYGLKAYFRRADRVLFPASAKSVSDLKQWPARLDCSLDALVNRFAAAGIEPLAVDITPALHHVDQGRTALSVARVLAPGLVPIWFGFRQEPLGMTPKPHAASAMPHPFP